MIEPEGKREFYREAMESLRAAGYQVFDGKTDIQGKGSQSSEKEDEDFTYESSNVFIKADCRLPFEICI
jgi:hypothetical protein